jgi:hypothetical protein
MPLNEGDTRTRFQIAFEMERATFIGELDENVDLRGLSVGCV